MLWLIPVVLIFSYLLGSIPFGFLVVKLSTGKDVRKVESGRTGGTNVSRAAGRWAGFLTAFLDGSKATISVWIARLIFPQYPWLHVLAPLLAIIGHNYSIFLIERNEKTGIRLGGGAGGAPCVGGSAGLWFPSVLIIAPLASLIFYFVGYASVTTMSVALISTLVFAYRAWIGASPWVYIFYGILAEGLLIWALRPNIRRLFAGEERRIGWRARRNNHGKSAT
jgi:acyl phosphate:glycerol-3-phosphate acyltransferase